MAVVGLEMKRRAPFAAGHTFGDAGAYERIDGVLRLAVDPHHAANAGVTDLAYAERGADGLVHFSADLCLLQPVDAVRSGRRLLLEVPNRGRKGALGRFNRPVPPGAPNVVDGGIAVGDGLLLRLGWTLAWCGWQWDVVRADEPSPDASGARPEGEGDADGSGGLLGFDAPHAVDRSGRPIHGEMLTQFQPDQHLAHTLLAHRIHKPYPVADVHEVGATLWVRDHPQAARTEVPRSRWRFARDVDGRPQDDPTHVWLEGGFEAGRIYELRYTTSICPVVGAGLLALRDCATFLRHGTATEGNPSAARLDHTLGFGASQCGRLLREYLYAAMNVDETGHQAYDGLLIHVAGARRGEFNHRYAQPSAITIPSFGYQPPMDFPGLLRRQHAAGGVPKVVTTNSSAEYWNREASLLHTDEQGTHDISLSDSVRVYHFAGTKHGEGSVAPAAGQPAPRPGSGQRPNVVNFAPLLRAALFHLGAWVAGGAEPPPSCHPRLADGTAAPPAEVLAYYRQLRDVPVPEPDKLYVRRPLDMGTLAAHGIGRYPAQETGKPYRWYVAALDGDGNELAGIRLPDVSVPVGTHTGWYARRNGTGGEGQNTDMVGSTIPFAPDEAMRRRCDDPRPSIAERYRDREDYAARARAAAQQLAADGYLLKDDMDLVVRNALDRYDSFVG